MSKHERPPWTTCRMCGRTTAHPDGRDLHRHVRAAHGISAWDYYQLYLDALQARIRAGVDLVKVRKGMSKCWVWRGRPVSPGPLSENKTQGYRTMRVAGAPTSAVHRLSVFAFTGVLPEAYEVVLHACDNAGCCNPKHLSCGTHTRNMRERQERNRQMRGTAHYQAKLTAEQVRGARQMAQWTSAAAIARQFQVHPGVIERVLRGESYRDVPQEAEIPF